MARLLGRRIFVPDGFAHHPVHVQRLFQREFGFAETAAVFSLNDPLPPSARAAWQSRSTHAAEAA